MYNLSVKLNNLYNFNVKFEMNENEKKTIK